MLHQSTYLGIKQYCKIKDLNPLGVVCQAQAYLSVS